MPLDEIGRRYADSFVQRRLHEFADEPQQINQLRNRHAARGSLLSGNYIHDYYQLLLQRMDSLAQAKVEGLIKAYEKSGVSFNDAAFYQSKEDVVDFCQQQQHQLIGTMGRVITQTFGQNSPAGLYDAVSQQIVSRVTVIIARLVSELSMKRDETLLEDRKVKRAYAAGLGKEWDLFVCHASEDKDFVDPLARQLRDSGLRVWYDVFSLKLGDSLRRKIDEGLAKSRYGIVVLSKHFFLKEWPQNELDGLLSREIVGTKVILPIWHNITFDEVRQCSPILAGRFAAKSEHGLDKVVSEIREVMGL